MGSEGKMAAASIQKQLVALGLKNNGILYRNSAVGSRYPDKSKADYYAVMAATTMTVLHFGMVTTG